MEGFEQIILPTTSSDPPHPFLESRLLLGTLSDSVLQKTGLLVEHVIYPTNCFINLNYK